MAQALGDYFEDAILDVLTGNNITAPSALYVGLFTTLPADTGSSGSQANGTEATGTNYARVDVGTLSSWLGAKSTANTTQRHRVSANDITFPQAGGSWGTIIGYGVWDASTNGNLLFYGSITSQAITSGMTPTLAAGQIDIALD